MPDPSPRFLTRAQVAEELGISESQAYALVRRGDLRALKIGGRGVWRIGRQDLEDYIARAYDETGQWIEEHPFDDGDDEAPEDDLLERSATHLEGDVLA